MRIIFFTILFLTPLYLLNRGEVPTAEVDSLKIKVSAPDRAERILTVEKPVAVDPEEPAQVPPQSEMIQSANSESESEADTETDESEEVQISDLEEAWSGELKQMLNRLEPVEGDAIHKAYQMEQESYQVTLESLMSEKQLKTSKEAGQEMEQLINQLEVKHQEKLKSILGAHYEAVRDHYDDYLETSSSSQD
jgi:hypothetical protein